MAKLVDLTGQRFGKLTVIERAANGKNGETHWKCKCDCGNISFPNSYDLRHKKTQSCGCNAAFNPSYDLLGKQFGRLTVVALTSEQSSSGRLWLCKCKCGNTTKVCTTSLVKGFTKSCGCLLSETAHLKAVKHNCHNSRLYLVWSAMKSRCYNPNDTRYRSYGALGVKVFDEWRTDFTQFQKWAFENGYDESAPRGECTLDRIDPYGNYEPSNCRWADAKTQNANKRKKKDTTPAD